MMAANCLDTTDPGGYYGHTLYYVQDALYTTRALVASKGWVIEEQTAYDVYGRPVTWTSGDADLDGDIDAADNALRAASFFKSQCDPNYNWRCDLDNSGMVNFGDLGAFSANRYASTPANYQSFFTNPYYFTGRRVDVLDEGNVRLQHNRSRYYDYYTGRWLTHDPLGTNPAGGNENPFFTQGQYTDALNLYEYVRSNPLLNSDPVGLSTIINDPWNSFWHYVTGGGAPATMGDGYLTMFKNSNDYKRMKNKIIAHGKLKAECKKKKKYTFSFAEHDVSTISWNIVYNETFGSLDSVDYSGKCRVNCDDACLKKPPKICCCNCILMCKAKFDLRDNYNFWGFNNFLLRWPFLAHLWGTPYDASGTFPAFVAKAFTKCK